MSTYVIGDIHGCYQTLETLLSQIRPTSSDRFWLVGDLVNGGPDSAQVLCWARDLGEQVVSVLGNHDLYLIGRALEIFPRRKRDTLDDLLDRQDGSELVNWLRHRPLLYETRSSVLVHAGLLPNWTLKQARQVARRAEARLQGPDAKNLLRQLFSIRNQATGRDGKPTGKKEEQQPAGQHDLAQLCLGLQALTSLRTCRRDGSPCDFTGPPEAAPPGCLPWFDYRPPASTKTFYFGHWAALGFRRLPVGVALDSGCVWGGLLTALRLEDGEIFQQPNREVNLQL